jgi:hypothetical protein
MKKFIYTLVILAFVSSVSAQWVQMSSGMDPSFNIKSLVANTGYIFAGTGANGVYYTTNNANLWIHTSLTSYQIRSLAVNGSILFVGTLSDGIYRSTDNGTSFTQVATSIIGGSVKLAISGSNIFAGTDGNGVFLSTNNGTNWTASLTSQSVMCIAASGNNVFAGTNGNGVFFSPNNGLVWLQTFLNNQDVRSLAISGSNVFAGTYTNGIFKSTNDGANWSQTSMPLVGVSALLIYGNNIFAGSNNGSIYQSTDFGTTWILCNSGNPGGAGSFVIANSYIFAGTPASVWRRPLSEVIGIQNISTETPSKYSLSQNYPNPFNPTTKIKFDVVRVGDVKIVVYDIMGREVQTLVNESLKPGTYEAAFDGSQLTSGVYFYKITVHHGGSSTGNFVETKKMLMIK